jgi:hypothetical protein
MSARLQMSLIEQWRHALATTYGPAVANDIGRKSNQSFDKDYG